MSSAKRCWSAFGMCLLVLVTGRLALAADAPLPEPVKVVWDLAKAARQTTPTRETICINGLWRWQPVLEAEAGSGAELVPADNWGFLRVPGPMPGGRSSGRLYPHPAWTGKEADAKLAWYQREITVPVHWTGRRVTVRTAYLNRTATTFLDGNRGPTIPPRGGVADITSLCIPGKKQFLSLFVMTTGGGRMGLCGDVYLESMPRAERIDDVKIDPSVRKWQLSLDSAVTLASGNKYILRGEILDGAKVVKEIASKPFAPRDVKNGRFTFSNPWKPDKLWDINTPQNMYDLKLTLSDADGTVLDQFLPIRFGFRELWLEGRDLKLNGTRLHCFEVPLDNGNGDINSASYDGARETFRRMKAIGVNMMYTHNYGCSVGSHMSFSEILRAADDCGMLVSLSQPRFLDYDWSAPDVDAAYAYDAEFYVRQAQNHPSVVFYSTSHNSTGYSQDQNPDQIDGIYTPWPDPAGKRMRVDRYGTLALRAQALIEKFDLTRPVYHHESGNLGRFYTLNCYLDFVPVQERSDWFSHWAARGVKPLILVEYGVPLDENWANWREGHGLFSNPRLLNQFFWPEWGVQFRGDVAYDITEQEKANIRYESKHWRDKETFHKSWMPFFDGRLDFPNVRDVQAMYIADNWPAFRTLGVTGVNAWAQSRFWQGMPNVKVESVPVATDWDNVQKPGYAPDTVRKVVSADDPAKEVAWEPVPNAAGIAIMRYNRPLLAYIAGGAKEFTSKDHNYLSGETVEKQLIIINNSRQTVKCDCMWSWLLEPAPGPALVTVTIQTGELARIPMRLKLPADLKRGRYYLTMQTRFSTGDVQTDSFTIDVLPKAIKPETQDRIALFDPKGETTKLLKQLGMSFKMVKPDADLGPYDLFIIGKHALALSGPALDLSGIRDGLKVVMFEQTRDVLHLRLGFRVEEYVLRQTFPRLSDHPALAGLAAANLANWRGEGTTVPHSLQALMSDPNEYPQIQWCGLTQDRAWRAGCRGSVASVLIEKPTVGDFLPIIDGGFSLQYSPLMEYREGKGMLLLCQMDVTGRTEPDPAANRLVANILSYVSSWKPPAQRELYYLGDATMKAHLESMGLKPRPLPNSGQVDLLLIGPEQFEKFKASKGGYGKRMLFLGFDEEDLHHMFAEVKTHKAEYINGDVKPQNIGSPFAGISPADVYDRDAREITLITGGAEILAGGTLARWDKDRIILCQLVPWQFNYTANFNLKPTFRRTSFLLTRVLANLGVSAPAPFLKYFAEPLPKRAELADVPDVVYLQSGDNQLFLPRVWKGLPLGKAELPTGWEIPGFKDANWRSMKVPGFWEEQYQDLVNLDGLFLYRVSFNLPAQWTARDVTLVLGGVDDEDSTYVNGQFVGSMGKDTNPNDYWSVVRRYKLPAGLLKPGRNVVAVKVNDLKGSGGMRASLLKLHGAGATRWLSGLYLDKPEFLDDVYRYYRW